MITFKSLSGIYLLEASQYLDISMDEAWPFFSSPGNLSLITPSHMGFRITSATPDVMYPGQIITYRVSPFWGYTTHWVTEITHVSDKHFFVDEQRLGPYKIWHHEHLFEKQGKGILMTDRVYYRLPFGIIGQIAHTLFVRRQLKKIFLFREAYLLKWTGRLE
ncbi:MAG: SRPBCC family protein [Bacteroidales bacterium]